MVIEAVTPTRVDLAGGTLDIYPLYLFENGGLTVNMAVDLCSYVKLEERKDREIHIYSEDLKLGVDAPDVNSLEFGGELDFIVRIVKFYAPEGVGLNITTRNEAPKGSGLGASSSLLIALSGAFNKLRGEPYKAEQLIDIGANLEAQSIRIPTGKQDYYAAVYGGVNAIWFEVERNHVEGLVKDEELFKALEEHLVLSFTGEPRFSAITNWDMMKNYIDGKALTIESMKKIKETAYAMREALLAGDLERLGKVLDEEWENRRNLAEGVSTPQIERVMEMAKAAGAIASKICGAGGGGCMISLVAPGKREAVIEAIKGAGAKHMEFGINREGLVVKSNNL